MAQGDLQKTDAGRGVGVLEYGRGEVPASRRWAGRLLAICGIASIADGIFQLTRFFYNHYDLMHEWRFWLGVAIGLSIIILGGCYLLLRGRNRMGRPWVIVCGVLMAVIQGGFNGYLFWGGACTLYWFLFGSPNKLSLEVFARMVGNLCIRAFFIVALTALVVSLMWPTRER